MKKKFKFKQDSSSIMLRSFMFLITVIILISGIITVIAVGNQLMETSQKSASGIIKSLKKTDIDGNDDWKNWRATNALDTSTSHVFVHNMRKDANTKYYYSPGDVNVYPFSHQYYRTICLSANKTQAEAPSTKLMLAEIHAYLADRYHDDYLGKPVK